MQQNFHEKATIENGNKNKIQKQNKTEYNQDLLPYDLQRIREIELASKVFPNEHAHRLIGCSDDLLYLANLGEHYAHRTVQYCRGIDAFRALNNQDRLQVMKSFYPEMNAVHMSYIYLEKKDGLRLLVSKSK